jgi:GNAT superfamily N-acetyltransferase
MKIAAAGVEDRADLLALLGAQLVEHALPVPATLAVAIDGVLEDPRRGRLLLARREGDGVALGVAYISFIWSIEHGGHSAWLDELYVVPAERSRGLGQQLLDAVVAAARADGCFAIDLEVATDQSRAERLYERNGFRCHQRRRWVRVLGDAP